MAVISEIPDGSDSNDGDDANKKPKEIEEKPKQVQKKLKEKVLYSLRIPNVLIINCFARVSRYHYPTLSLVSSPIYQLISSPEIYTERSNIGHSECVLYAYIDFPPSENPSWYILHRKPYRNLRNTVSLKLGKIDSLPPIPPGSAVVTLGSDMYVLGGCIGDLTRTSNVTLIDCKSHTSFRLVPRMRMARRDAAAGVIDGMIYVVGGCEIKSLDWVEVFDVKEQTWSRPRLPIQPNNWFNQVMAYAVMEEKIYIMEDQFCYAYDPNETDWFTDDHELDNWLLPLWNKSSFCVIDDMMFCIDRLWPTCGGPVVIYNPVTQEWRHMLGLQGFPAPSFLKYPKMTSFGGNLVILSGDQSEFASNCEYVGKKEICYVEISWERVEDDEIWGTVESVAVVLTTLKSPSVELCRTVMV